jgi:2-polyprenyl-3-methyl-5-hydroxy-6-metoxy-1,4-benzoquinol methylase
MWADEGQRLFRFRHNRLELLRTRELLLRQLPSPPAVVLDVGGGTGVHAAWLAGRGYRVHLVDVVPEHVRAVAEHGLVTAEAPGFTMPTPIKTVTGTASDAKNDEPLTSDFPH